MSYEQQVQLRADGALQGRTSACVFQEAYTFKDDGRPDIAALANRHLIDSNEILTIWMPFIAAAPGFADNADDTSLITDGDILAAVQGMWPSVAPLYYNTDGTPI